MPPPDRNAHYSPPGLLPQAEGKNKKGFLIATVVIGTVTCTLCGSAGAVLVAIRASRDRPPVARSEVWFDNRSAERLSVEVDGKVQTTVEPQGTHGAVAVLRLVDGKHTFRLLDPSLAPKASRTLDLSAARVIYAVGGQAQYAVVTVHYALPTTAVVADSARLLPRNEDGTVWQLPWTAAVDPGMDRPFPDRSARPELHHVCRVIAGQVQCEGGPAALTSSGPFTATSAPE